MKALQIPPCIISIGFDPGIISPEVGRIGLDAETAVKCKLVLGVGGAGLVPVFGRLTAEGPESQHLVGYVPVFAQIVHAFRFRLEMADLFTEDRGNVHDDAGHLYFDAAAFAERRLFDIEDDGL